MPERITKTQRWLDLIALLLGRQVPMSVEEIMERVPAYAQGWNAGGETERASARRKFERDKDELRGLGIPMESVKYAINYGAETIDGYRIVRRDFYLPYLRVLEAGSAPKRNAGRTPTSPRSLPTVELTPDQAATALDALRQIQDVPDFPYVAEARSAFGKLAFDLDPERYPAMPIHWADRDLSGSPTSRPDRSDTSHKTVTQSAPQRLRTLSDALLARKRVCFRYHGAPRKRSRTAP